MAREERSQMCLSRMKKMVEGHFSAHLASQISSLMEMNSEIVSPVALCLLGPVLAP